MVYHSSLSLSDLFSRKRKDEAADAGADWPVYPTKALAKFLANLNARSQRLLLDLGPVVGSNVTFFGEELGCKIHVEDLFKDIDRHVTEGTLDALPSFLAKRFAQEDGTVDGILCWDIFDYLDKASAQVLAVQHRGSGNKGAAWIHAVRGGRSPEAAVPVVPGGARQAEAAVAPRYPAAVRAAAHLRTVPAEEQPPGSLIPQAERRDNHRRGRACQSSRC
jgi:hypothetical protein